MNEVPQTPLRRPTIIDVARLAGVSPATVSNALSGKRRVEPATRERIEQAIRDLGYRPNTAAQSIRTGRTNLIAVVSSMPVTISGGASRQGFFMEIASAAATFALEHDLSLVLVPPAARPEQALAHVAVDGALILEPQREDAFLAALRARGVPVICIGQSFDPALPYVDLDYRRIARLLIDHLFARGARRFPLIVGAEHRMSHAVMREIYEQRAAERGMTPHVIHIEEACGEDGGYHAAHRAMRLDPDLDAVLVPVDTFATGAMRGLRELGKRVPDDVMVATRYDGWRARMEKPPLTAIDPHLDEIADIATRWLASLIGGTGGQPPTVAASPPELIPRASTRASEG
ncbi:MAG: LacI family DNA-binding transcriptional regulator [Paracoccus sp. (in: a-proteobacteria)]|uniref:LacI family DNA-binding transcriptional regulator n=1 Tax=Paracoccus sp. TaxID=267 RepID=UPI0039E4600A